MLGVVLYIFFSLITAVAIPVIATTMYYLFYWAKLTKRLWSAYSEKTSSFMRCPACSGTWYACVVAICFWVIGMPFLGLPARTAPPFDFPAWHLVRFVTPLLAALWGTFWVPILANKHLDALNAIGEHQLEKPDGANDGTV